MNGNPTPAIQLGREYIRKPIVGIMEAAIFNACLVGNKFSIITSSKRWEPLLVDGVRSLGISERCASVRSSGLSVMDFNELNDHEIVNALSKEAEKAVREDKADAICLGCAGMAGLEERISEQLRVPVIDGVQSAIYMTYGLISMAIETSKAGAYEPIPSRPYQFGSYDWRAIYHNN